MRSVFKPRVLGHLLGAAILGGVLAACNGGDQSISADPSHTIERINTPFREHGYSNFNSLIVASQARYDEFIAEVESQDAWNAKQAFLEALADISLDFDQDNLVIYRMTEGSGSISLTPQLARLEGDIAVVEIEREAPSIGTADMAFYALAYKVSQSVNAVHFTTGGQATVFSNVGGTNLVPDNCTAWTDECGNTCTRLVDGFAACTEKACTPTVQEIRCQQWSAE